MKDSFTIFKNSGVMVICSIFIYNFLVNMHIAIHIRVRKYVLNKPYYYLLKIIQEFWLVKSFGWNHHIRPVVAQIWSYDITIEYWKYIYDIRTPKIFQRN